MEPLCILSYLVYQDGVRSVILQAIVRASSFDLARRQALELSASSAPPFKHGAPVRCPKYDWTRLVHMSAQDDLDLPTIHEFSKVEKRRLADMESPRHAVHAP